MSAMNGTNPNDLRLNELYQEVILDHNKRPRNFGKLAEPHHSAHGKNPLCGDDYFVYLAVDASGKIEQVAFEGSGCAISKASASMMTALVKDKTAGEAEALKDNFIRLLTDRALSKETLSRAGSLKIFEGVRQFPIRVKCATLAWRALEEALKGSSKEVSTE